MVRRGSIYVMALLLSAGTLAACKSKSEKEFEDAPAMKVGIAPAGKPLAVGKPEKSGELATYGWPEACEYLPEADVRAILPSATSVTLKQESVVFSTSLFGQAKETVRDAQCTIEVMLPEKDDAPTFPLRIHVVERGYGTPPFAKSNYESNVTSGSDKECPATLVKSAGLDACGHSSEEWHFLKKRTAIEVKVDTFVPSGAKFEGMPDPGTTDKLEIIHAARMFWENDVAARFVAAVAARAS
ncbi:hypothetical protein [Actinoplanes sp. L3-i22]|uniref:hypothetical protein n=1 Tax=Actinoplanes sp. L3-i22 TaxID=2836373 RepID=UPI001C766E75|nr:hypothetical protein [Actinoplanes sp. L3-i22]BCY06270.1 hypothetical protein L3i22_013580 [Actinoplanes sp. L3-i22]